jgi:tetraacyldisaccharide 4'-kinase
LNRVWYEGAASGVWLAPFGWVYGVLTAARRALYESGMLPSFAPPVPVIVVGNLTIGGTGKTPLVIWLTEQLARRGFKPGVVTRGYAGSVTGPTLVSPAMSALEVGDEPLLIAARTHRSVVVARDRVAGARLLADCGVNLVIADDGLQHYRLRRSCEIVVIDGERRFGNGRLLPAGPLRESRARLESADIVVTNGGLPAAGELPMRLVGESARSLAGGAERSLDSFRGQTVHGVAGIGHPRRFFSGLRRRGIDLIEHTFTDHHLFRPQDLDFGDARPVLMTEKDAVKCRSFARADWWAVPVNAQFDDRAAEVLMAAVLAKVTGSIDHNTPRR